jgi:GT2 family glycosyltransferase
MTISVIIPTCHRNDLLAKCLDCLAPDAQTLSPEQYEVIVTDDGSKSTAEQMVREQYPWAKWVAGPCKGPAANRNTGAKYAQGEWLVFTDDDCLPTASWLASYAASITDANSVYEGKTICVEGVTSPLYQSPINLTGGCLWSCNFMIRSSLFRELDGFDTEFAMPAMEDIDLHERLCQRGQSGLFVDAAIVDHPPRRATSGVKSGKMYEAKVQYWNKRGQYNHSFLAYIKHLKHYLHGLRRFGLHRDVFPAVYALLTETLYVIPRLSGWERKYRDRYRA